MDPFMKEAIAEADSGISSRHGGPFGAVIIKEGKIVGRGHNRVVEKLDPTCHGEMEAIRDACKNLKTFDLTGCTLYTTGEPCPMCMGAILWANIDKVFYGCNVDDTDEIGFRDDKFYQRFRLKGAGISQELDREECKKLYARYKAQSGNVKY